MPWWMTLFSTSRKPADLELVAMTRSIRPISHLVNGLWRRCAAEVKTSRRRLRSTVLSSRPATISILRRACQTRTPDGPLRAMSATSRERDLRDIGGDGRSDRRYAQGPCLDRNQAKDGGGHARHALLQIGRKDLDLTPISTRIAPAERSMTIQTRSNIQPHPPAGNSGGPRFQNATGRCGEKNGRSGGIRTHDPLTPSQVRYRAALRSEPRKALIYRRYRGKR
jgi:hypothetical protein